MEQKAGAQIGIRAFIQSLLILLILMIFAGVLTRVIPSGSYNRVIQGGREMIDPASFHIIDHPAYPIWRWFTAPVEVLWGPNAITLITIILFILLVGGSFAVLDATGILNSALASIVNTFGEKKYTLLLVITFFFMLMGAFFGLFEEVVPLVPLSIALAYSLGWDVLVGLGMSILATNMGFSAAITNPFTIGIAQKLAGLPLFSGVILRIPIFLVVYIILAIFLTKYAKKIEKDPSKSLVYGQDSIERSKYKDFKLDPMMDGKPISRIAMAWFLISVILVILVLFGSPFIPFLSEYALPLVGILFFLGGIGAGLFSGAKQKIVFKALGQGFSGIAPGIPLILMAASIKHIIALGGVMDTILNWTSLLIKHTTTVNAALIIYLIALVIELFIASAGAKAILIMPILLPLADLVGVTRQVTVTAYCFGDGFSNLAYPTNPVLLIVLGLASISYSTWIKWTIKLWGWIIVATVLFLWIAVAIHYGPF